MDRPEHYDAGEIRKLPAHVRANADRETGTLVETSSDPRSHCRSTVTPEGNGYATQAADEVQCAARRVSRHNRIETAP